MGVTHLTWIGTEAHERIVFLIRLLPFFPLAGAILNGLLGRRFPKGVVSLIACGAPLLSFLFGVSALHFLLQAEPTSRVVEVPLYRWLTSGGGAPGALDIRFGFLYDPLSAVMVLVVSGVGFLIHVYSTGYMADDPGYRRYFAYLNLFLFAMLLLVLGGSLPLLFFGWEGVGLCSYLLIGFWFEDPLKADAGKKAFIVNRIGDLGFVLGMLLFFRQFGTLEFGEEAQQAVKAALDGGAVSPGAVAAIALLLFVGAIGKSAQIPLFVWLPDAMAGPTPVSALIHAATMVTAGVYMVARMNFLYGAAPAVVGEGIAGIGLATALVAGAAAVAQRDIKKVLAYSTVSQLGFMFLALGVGAYGAAIFHVVTHAFFKALLFLGAGAVIHALHGEQDMFRMGGLRKALRPVFLTMLIGAFALAGIFPLAGFWSKDEILLATLERSVGLWIGGLLAALCTAFYSLRLIAVTFLGEAAEEPSGGHGTGADAPADAHGPSAAGVAAHGGLHKPGFSMVSVLVVLAGLTVLGGALGLPRSEILGRFLEPVWRRPETTGSSHAAGLPPALLNAGVSLFLAIAGAAAAWSIYTAGRDAVRRWMEGNAPMIRLREAAFNAFYVDRTYDRFVVRALRNGAFLLWLVADVLFIDLLCVNGLAAVTRGAGRALRGIQSGVVNHYAAAAAAGALLALAFLLDRAVGGGVAALLGLR